MSSQANKGSKKQKKKEKFLCPVKGCKKDFSRRDNLKRHIRDQHSKQTQKFKCPICGKELKRLDNLNAHMKICTGNIKWSECEWCLKSFNRKSNLTRHKFTCSKRNE